MQTLSQVSDSMIKASLLGTVRTQLALAVEHDDAALLAKRFGPLTSDDLSGLDTFEAAVRLCINGVTRPPVTMKTLPIAPLHPEIATRLAEERAAISRERYSRPRAEVEARLRPGLRCIAQPKLVTRSAVGFVGTQPDERSARCTDR